MEQKIPKIIHYCWLGNNPMPPLVLDCMESWKRMFPDYQIICWNEENSPIDECAFAKEAFRAKKWAFATDYIRLYALYNYGGIYLDTDVMVYKSFDNFLYHEAFAGIEFHPDLFYRSIKKDSFLGLGIATSVMGCMPKHPIFKVMLDYYKGQLFRNNQKFMDSMVNTRIIPELLCPYGFKYVPLYQLLEQDFHIYPPDVFSSRTFVSLVKYSTHFFANSWREKVQPSKYKKFVLEKILGLDNWAKIRKYVKISSANN